MQYFGDAWIYIGRRNKQNCYEEGFDFGMPHGWNVVCMQ
jgi:hypothetical protein